MFAPAASVSSSKTLSITPAPAPSGIAPDERTRHGRNKLNWNKTGRAGKPARPFIFKTKTDRCSAEHPPKLAITFVLTAPPPPSILLA